MDAPCQSHRRAETICADGFIQRPACSGQIGCLHCGRFDGGNLPHCLSDNLPAHWLTEGGASKFLAKSEAR